MNIINFLGGLFASIIGGIIVLLFQDLIVLCKWVFISYSDLVSVEKVTEKNTKYIKFDLKVKEINPLYECVGIVWVNNEMKFFNILVKGGKLTKNCDKFFPVDLSSGKLYTIETEVVYITKYSQKIITYSRYDMNTNNLYHSDKINQLTEQFYKEAQKRNIFIKTKLKIKKHINKLKNIVYCIF